MQDDKPSIQITPCLRLVDRLRGIYTIPVNDGAGPLNGKDTFTPVEPFFTPPVQKEAASRIDHLELVIRSIMEAIDDQDYHGAYVMCREALK